MAGKSAGAPRERRQVSGATLSLIAVAFSELRRDVQLLIDTDWDEPVRRRAEELSTTLAQACQRQGLDDLTPLVRSAANLARLTKANALPVLSAIGDKFDMILRDIDTALAKRSNRFIG